MQGAQHTPQGMPNADNWTRRPVHFAGQAIVPDMFTEKQKRLWLTVVAAAVLLFMALIVVFGVSEGKFMWGF
jgi:hypothetical protein